MSATRHNTVQATFGRVVLVASLGGLKALSTVLAGLPPDFAVPVVVAQHRRPTVNGDDPLVQILSRATSLPVRVAEAGVSADKPGITIVPAATAAAIDANGAWLLAEDTSNVSIGDTILASSAAQVPTVAVILTGRLADGANGCRAIKRNGGRVLVQDPATAQASSMPAHAIATGCVDFVLPPDRLASAVLALTTAPGGAELLTVPVPPWACLN